MSKMQERVLKYLKIANNLKLENSTGIHIANVLYNEMKKNNQELSYAITIKVLDKLGYTNREIDYLMSNTQWKSIEKSAEDLFFDAIELDDDLIN